VTPLRKQQIEKKIQPFKEALAERMALPYTKRIAELEQDLKNYDANNADALAKKRKQAFDALKDLEKRRGQANKNLESQTKKAEEADESATSAVQGSVPASVISPAPSRFWPNRLTTTLPKSQH